MVKVFYRIITSIVYAVLIAILIFFSIYLVKRLSDKDGITEVFGISFFEVATGSMEPEINVGDLVIIQKKDSSYYDVGMTVTYLPKGAKTPVTHKIVDRDGDTIITRGISDTNNTDDEPFDVSQIIGVKIGIWYGYYKFSKYITSPLGIITIILGGFLLVEGFAFLNKKILGNEKEIKKEE